MRAVAFLILITAFPAVARAQVDSRQIYSF